jgi:signal transduction histidine kinase
MRDAAAPLHRGTDVNPTLGDASASDRAQLNGQIPANDTIDIARLTRAASTLSALRMLGALCIVLPLVIFVVVGVYRYQQIHQETVVRLDRALRIAHEQALKVLDTNATLLARAIDTIDLTTLPPPESHQEALHRQLKALAQNVAQVREIAIYGPAGRAIASSETYPLPADFTVAHTAEYDWLRKHNDNKLYLSEPHTGNAGGSSFDLSRALHSPNGAFAGFVAVSLRSAYFRKFHEDLASEEPGLSVAILRDDGFILSRSPKVAGAPTRIAADSAVMGPISAGRTQANVIAVSSIDGKERMVLARKLADYPVFLTAAIPTEEITMRWLTEMGWLAAFGLPPLLGLFFAARVALRRTREMITTAGRLQTETATRRRAEEALLQAQKLEALGRLTGGVAHDFNNALMIISSNLFLLKRKYPEMASNHLDSIGRAVGSATKLTRQLLAFSRRQALVPEYVDLHERLPSIKDLLTPVLGGQIELSLSVAPETSGIQIDPAELELALINLAINARDAMPSGGSFRITARNALLDLPALFEGRQMVLIEAADTGSGIEPELLTKVFEPFFTTKAVGQGTGLGLSQIYGLCQRGGGTADVRSVRGEGTTVRLFFPAVEAPDLPAMRQRSPSRPALNLNVLMVEDNDEVAAVLKPLLEELGCSVRRMDRAGAARDWLATATVLPDLLLSDVVMPGEMDGVALAQFVRDRHPGLHTVLMTGYAEQQDTISRMGFVIIPKPCSADTIAQAIRRVGAVKPER